MLSELYACKDFITQLDNNIVCVSVDKTHSHFHWWWWLLFVYRQTTRFKASMTPLFNPGLRMFSSLAFLVHLLMSFLPSLLGEHINIGWDSDDNWNYYTFFPTGFLVEFLFIGDYKHFAFRTTYCENQYCLQDFDAKTSDDHSIVIWSFCY